MTDLRRVVNAALIAAQIVLGCHLRHTELHAVLTAGEQPLKSGRSLKFDEIVGVLLHVFAVHQPPGQLQDPHGKFRVVQHLQRPLRGQLPGVVVVVAQHQLLGVPAQQPDLLRGQRRAHGGHCVVEARLMQRYHVQIAFTQDHVGPFRFFGQIQPVQHPPLAVYRRFGAVHVFRLRFVDNAAAEAHHVAPYINDRQHQPVAELVVESAVLVGHDQPRSQQLLLGIAFCGHGPQQGVPAVRRRPHAEPYGDLPLNGPLVKIGPHCRAVAALQHIVVPAGRVAVQGQQPLAQPVGIGGLPVLGNLHVDPLGQKPHRVGIGQVLDLHNEVDDAAALFAAEAVIELLVLQNVERGRLFIVERAAAPVASALRCQRHIGTHHVHDVIAGDQLVQKCLGKHGGSSFLRRTEFASHTIIRKNF